MKKAEEYVKVLDLEFDNEGNREYYNNIIIKAIKQAQRDAIDETVKLCAEKTEVVDDILWKCVDKNSILNCAELLKKEIE